MKPTELRIGNSVMNLKNEIFSISKIFVYKGKPKQIKTNKIGMWRGNVYQEKGFDKIFPVPLTEEALGRLGFDIKELDSGREHYTNQIGVYKGGDHFEYVLSSSNDSHGGWNYETIILGDVHHLQNLHFLLTGEEVTLDYKLMD